MDKRVFGIGMTLAMLVLAVMTVPAIAGPNTVYFVPQNSSAYPGETVYVEVWLNVTDPYGIDPQYALATMQVNVTFDPSIGNITACKRVPGDPWDVSWDGVRWGDSWWICTMNEPWDDPEPPYGLDPGVYPIANLTIVGVSPGVMDLHFSRDLPRYCDMYDAIGEVYPNQTWIDGTFTCIAPPWGNETFSKSLVTGWNLISLPLTNATNMTVANIMSSVSGKYDALYRYDAVNKSWVSMSPSDEMKNGVGYFIHMTEDATWTYTGIPYTEMNISLQPGLNMVGWLNCSKDITDALSSIDGKYWYVARWNATAQEFEVYNPVAPPVFNDFDMLEPTTGYFISMKESAWLNVSC